MKKKRYVAPEVKYVNPKEIIALDGNPQDFRCDPNDKHFQALYKSISEIGQIVPIIVEPLTNRCYEGHRRLAVCNLLSIPVLCLFSVNASLLDGVSLKQIYRDINRTQKKHTGIEKTAIYVEDPDLLQHKDRTVFKRAEKILGYRYLVRLAKRGTPMSRIRKAMTLNGWCMKMGIELTVGEILTLFENRNLPVREWDHNLTPKKIQTLGPLVAKFRKEGVI